MGQPGRIGRRSWRMTSVGALVAAGAVLAGTLIANAAAPALPKRTAAQLLADAMQATVPSALSAVVVESANLGFPAIPDIAGLSSSALSAASLITGTHTVDIWYAGPQQVRIALPVSFGETDLRVNGNQVWLWDSQTQTATRYIIPAALSLPSRPAKSAPAPAPAVSPVTPLQVAKMLLARIGPTTSVTVQGTTTVADHAAYQLAIAPRTSSSLIRQIVIAIDAKTYLPLQVQVFARGMSGPAFQIGFTSFTPGRPDMSNFAFKPPPGAKVKTVKLAALLSGFHVGWTGLPEIGTVLPGGVVRQIGMPPRVQLRIVKLHGVARVEVRIVKLHGVARFVVLPPGVPLPVDALRSIALPRGVRLRIAGLRGLVVARGVTVGQVPLLPPPAVAAVAPSGPQLLGSGWLTVAVLPAGFGPTALGAVSGNSSWVYSSGSAQPAKTAMPSSAVPAVNSPMMGMGGSAGQLLALLHILLNATTRVHGTWGTGRLLQTSLFSVLITSKGEVLIGAVTPSVLYADAAKVK